MKNCNFFDYIKIFVFSPEDLSEEKQKEIQEHLAICSICAKEFEDLNSIREVVEKEKIDFPDEEFFEKLPEHIIEHIGNRVVERTKILKPAIVFSVFIIMVIMFSYFSFNKHTTNNIDLDVYLYDILQTAKMNDNSFYFDDLVYDFSDVDTTYYLEDEFTIDDITLIENNLDKIHILEDKK